MECARVYDKRRKSTLLIGLGGAMRNINYDVMTRANSIISLDELCDNIRWQILIHFVNQN